MAKAIKHAVREINLAVPSYRDFDCRYTSADAKFTLISGSAGPRQSSVAVSGGDLAAPLKLNTDTGVLVPGRAVTPGAAKVVPQEKLGGVGGGRRHGKQLRMMSGFTIPSP